MAIKSKTQLQTDISTDANFTTNQKNILTDVVDSYEDIFPQVTTIQRNALTPTTGLIIFNMDVNRYEYWNGSAWFGIGQNVSTPFVVKVDLSSADILALDSTPILISVSPGAGYSVIAKSYTYRFIYGSAAYAGGDILIKHSTAANPMASILNIAVLSQTNDNSGSGSVSFSGQDNMIEDDDLVLEASAAITTGDGTLTIWVTCEVIVW